MQGPKKKKQKQKPQLKADQSPSISGVPCICLSFVSVFQFIPFPCCLADKKTVITQRPRKEEQSDKKTAERHFKCPRFIICLP